MLKSKSIVTCVVLSIVTCGIYGLVWLAQMVDDVKIASGDDKLPEGGMAILLTIITCGIYGYYLIYILAKAMITANRNNGFADTDNSVLYLVLMFCGLGIVDYCLIQNDLNAIADKANNTVPTPVA